MIGLLLGGPADRTTVPMDEWMITLLVPVKMRNDGTGEVVGDDDANAYGAYHKQIAHKLNANMLYYHFSGYVRDDGRPAALLYDTRLGDWRKDEGYR